MNIGKLFLGILAATVTGATLGILLAPDNGRSTRRKITHKASAYAGEIGERFHQMIDNATQEFQTLKEEISQMAEDGKSELDLAIAGIEDLARIKASQKKPSAS